MMKILKNIIFWALIGLAFNSCRDDENDFEGITVSYIDITETIAEGDPRTVRVDMIMSGAIQNSGSVTIEASDPRYIITNPVLDRNTGRFTIDLGQNDNSASFTVAYPDENEEGNFNIELKIVDVGGEIGSVGVNLFVLKIIDNDFSITAPYSENFDALCTGDSEGLPEGWTIANVTSDYTWRCSSSGRGASGDAGDFAFEMSNFGSPDGIGSEDWLITPKINLTDGNVVMTFNSLLRYTGSTMEVFYTENYVPGENPNNYTWTALTAATSAWDTNTDSWDYVPSGAIDLSGINARVFIGFKHIATGSGSGGSSTIRIDDFRLQEGGSVPTLSATGTINDFGSINVGSSSASQTITLSANNLSQNVSVTTSTGFEVSKDDASFNNSLTFTSAELNGNTTSLFVRFTPTSGVNGAKTGTLSVASPEATNLSFPLAGTEAGNTNVAVIEETFDNCSGVPAGWLAYSVVNDDINWQCSDFGNNGTTGFSINGFSGGAQETDDWLISPAVNFDLTTGEQFFISIDRRYDGPDLEVMYSSDYDGSSDPSNYTWTDVPGYSSPAPASANGVWNELGPFDVSGVTGNSVYFAIRYTSGAATGASRYNIDDVRLLSGPGNFPSLTVNNSSITNFGSVDNGQVSSAQSYTISGANLSQNVTATASANFEISTDNATFSNAVVLTSADLTAGNVEVFVRFAPTSGTNGEINGSISHTSSEVSTQSFAVSGTETGNAGSGTTDILTARAMMGETVTIQGVVTSPDYGFNNGQYYVQDATGGINIFHSGNFGLVQPGDNVTMEGVVGEFNGQVQFAPSSVTVNSSGSVPASTAITTSELTVDSNRQGMYVEIAGVSLDDPSVWPTEALSTGSGLSVAATVGGISFEIRIDRGESFFDGSTTPPAEFTLKGNLGRFNDVVQIMPFFDGDISEGNGGGGGGNEGTTILEARGMDGQTVTISGVVTSPDYGFNNGQYYIQDATGGINVFHSGNFGLVQPGDNVTMTGVIGAFSEQVQIAPTSLTVNSSGSVPAATTITTSDLTPDSSRQGMYVEISGVTLNDPSQWPTNTIGTGSGVNVDVTANGVTFQIRIDRGESFFDGSSAPTGEFTLKGNLGRFNDTVQVMPFFEGDVQ